MPYRNPRGQMGKQDGTGRPPGGRGRNRNTGGCAQGGFGRGLGRGQGKGQNRQD